MSYLKEFLESSTIHGLYHISVNQKIAKVLWIVIIISGFVGSGIIIYQSFEDWKQSPVKTTIESVSISDFKFPKITVCPPKDTYTNLNYDMMITENMTIEEDTRKNWILCALNLIKDNELNTVLLNLRTLKISLYKSVFFLVQCSETFPIP